jgi:hypothetical protein
MPVVDTAIRTASSTGGQALRVATGLVSVRPADKPLHPRGTLLTGTLHRFGGAETTGVTWLDHAGRDDVLVRLSRAVGLPSPVPDIFGLAVRVPAGEDRYADLLFATTGLGRLTRFTLTPARSAGGRPMTTLLPYRTPAGPVVLSAVLEGDDLVTLSWALGAGVWHRFAELSLGETPAGDGDTDPSFDPIRHVLPGLENYPWVRRLREPSYASSRRSRRA